MGTKATTYSEENIITNSKRMLLNYLTQSEFLATGKEQ